ncbi:hypothetical protein HDU76_006946 [Blyttiomyces sp. JEL0837]|nr:hypothetical protein HDU76_006946 [Blyttiomyces sp. JEL0837]
MKNYWSVRKYTRRRRSSSSNGLSLEMMTPTKRSGVEDSKFLTGLTSPTTPIENAHIDATTLPKSAPTGLTSKTTHGIETRAVPDATKEQIGIDFNDNENLNNNVLLGGKPNTSWTASIKPPKFLFKYTNMPLSDVDDEKDQHHEKEASEVSANKTDSTESTTLTHSTVYEEPASDAISTTTNNRLTKMKKAFSSDDAVQPVTEVVAEKENSAISKPRKTMT